VAVSGRRSCPPIPTPKRAERAKQPTWTRVRRRVNAPPASESTTKRQYRPSPGPAASLSPTAKLIPAEPGGGSFTVA